MRNVLVRLGLAMFLGSLASGRADASYIDFAFVGSGISGSGVVNVLANGNGTYTATSGMLAVFGDTSVFQADLVANPKGTGVSYAPGVLMSFGQYDDQIFPAATPTPDSNGLYFQVGTHAIFLSYISGLGYDYFDQNTHDGTDFENYGFNFYLGPVQSGSAPAEPAFVPEPSSLAMCGVAGVAGLVVARRRRKRAAA